MRRMLTVAAWCMAAALACGAAAAGTGSKSKSKSKKAAESAPAASDEAVESRGARGRAAEEPELSFEQDGDDLIVTMTVRVNNSAHALVTDAWVHPRGSEVRLFYCVIQNQDLLVRSEKDLEIQWRLPGHQQGDEPYHVDGSVVTRDSSELENLASQLEDLANAGIDRQGGGTSERTEDKD